MTRDDIIRLALEHFGTVLKPSDLEVKLAALAVAAEREALIKAGWRQCAEGQRTTQFCALLEAAVKAEREACAKICDGWASYGVPAVAAAAQAIRARGEQEQPQ